MVKVCDNGLCNQEKKKTISKFRLLLWCLAVSDMVSVVVLSIMHRIVTSLSNVRTSMVVLLLTLVVAMLLC